MTKLPAFNPAVGFNEGNPMPVQPAMRRALDLAALAAAEGEVPVGAVVEKDGVIIAEAANAMRSGLDPTAHAEIVAIRRAATALKSDRLDGCTLWVTLEPCAMCAGAISHARISRLYYGASDVKGGGVENGARVFNQTTCHHRPEVYSGIGEAEASAQLQAFFSARR
jgi:tRNA(adenine34) deaminase